MRAIGPNGFIENRPFKSNTGKRSQERGYAIPSNSASTVSSVTLSLLRGIKHDFPFINIRKVPREVLKTEDEALGFQPYRGTLRMLMNEKIMFDRYYCINSAKHCENEENRDWLTIFYNLITISYARTLLKTMRDSGPVQVLIILHVLCVAPGNKHN